MRQYKRWKVIARTNMADCAAGLIVRFAGAIAVSLALPIATSAGEAPTNQVWISQEVVVTARKWVEPVQEVPGSVAVRSADDLAAAGARDLRDSVRGVPNITLGEFSTRRLTFPYVRGIGSGQNDPAVITCLDGVPQLSYVTANQELLDVERVEYLRGPQGALYGRDALGGVINIVPRLPSREAAGSVAFSAGSYGLFDGRVAAEGALGESGVLGSLSGGYATREGYTKNDVTGNDLDSREAWFGRAQIYLPDQGPWDFRLSVTAERDRDGDYALYDLSSIRTHPHHVSHDYEGDNDRELVQPVFTVLRRGDAVDLTSITAFQGWRTDSSTDLDTTPADLQIKHVQEDYSAWIQELRLASPADAPVPVTDRIAMHWLAGVFAFDSRYKQDADTDYRPGGVALGYWPGPFRMSSDADLETLGASVFGQATFMLDERWELGLGLRNDFEHHEADLSSRIPPGPTLSSSNPSEDFNRVTPRASLGYQFTPHAMAYTLVSQGYRAGGFNAVAPAGRDSFDEETSLNYEAGLKTGWLDNRLIANAALFRTDWDDLQVNTHVPGGNASEYYIANGGKAWSRGGEFELTAKPMKALSLFGGVGCVDAEYRTGSRSADQAVGGNDLPFAPQFTWHAGAQVTEDFSRQRQVFVRLAVTGMDRYYYDASNLESQRRYELVTLRAGYAMGGWRVEGWVDNLFDRDYVPLAIPYGQDAAGNPFYVGESGAPRTLGLSLVRAF
jgi:iron complex outermembrane receptor protein